MDLLTKVFEELNDDFAEAITPYKVCLYVLIESYATSVKNDVMSVLMRQPSIIPRNSVCLILELLNKEEKLPYDQLYKFVEEKFHANIFDYFRRQCTRLCDHIQYYSGYFKGLPCFDVLQTVDRDQKMLIEKNSIIGRFIRRLRLAESKCSFTEVFQNWCRLVEYHGSELNMEFCDTARKDISITTGKYSSLGFIWPGYAEMIKNLNPSSSKKSSSKFLKHQIHCLLIDPSEAAPYNVIENKLNELKTSNSISIDAMLLRYLNAERYGDYVGATNALHEFLDWSACRCVKSPQNALSDWSRILRFGPFKLAKLNRRFGYEEKAIGYLLECITKAQESNDNECLNYALAEYCTILRTFDRKTYDSLIDSVGNDSEICETHFKMELCRSMTDFEAGANPLNTIERLRNKTNDLDHSGDKMFDRNKELMSHSFLSSLYLAHGHLDQCELQAKLVLASCPERNVDLDQLDHTTRIDKTDVQNRSFQTELKLMALCNLATSHYLKGNIDRSDRLLEQCDQFCRRLTIPDFCVVHKAWIRFNRSVYILDFDSCHKLIMQLSSVSANDAILGRFLLSNLEENVEKSFQQVKTTFETIGIVYDKCRFLITMADYYYLTVRNIGLSLHYLQQCKVLAESGSFRILLAQVLRRTAIVKVSMKLFDFVFEFIDQSIDLLKDCDHKIELAKSYLHKAQFLLICPGSVDSNENVEKLLKESINLFNRCQAFYLEKEAHFALAHYYDVCGSIELRNQSSKSFKDLDSKYPGTYLALLL